MENIILIIVLYFLGTLVTDKAKRKQRRKNNRNQRESIPIDFDMSSAQKNNSWDFEIPELEGAPNSKPNIDTDINFDEKPKEIQKEPIETTVKSTENLQLSSDNVRYGIVLAEILGKPKAYRHMRR